MARREDSLRRLLDWINMRSVTRGDISADDVRNLQDAQRTDQLNKDRQVWGHGSMNDRH